ncbi:MAG: hypothetical protein HYZ27_11145, partial [Deltaproteobacteria bacterium]|nr:hypothetical protein [Deltaproteobacteria bacterium]
PQDPALTNFCATPCPSGNAFTITEAGVFEIAATFDDGVNPIASASAYLLVERQPDLAPPVVALQNFTRNGLACPSAGCICSAPNACIFAPGDDIAFEVAVTDQGGISEVTYTAFFVTDGGAGTLRTRTVLVAANTAQVVQPFFFAIPGGAGVEDVDLVAQAVDAFANSANSAAFIIQVRPISPVANLDGQTRTTSIVATSAGFVGNMWDAVYDGLGRLIIADNGNDQLLHAISPTQLAVLAAFPGGAAPNDGTPQFLASDLAGNLLVSMRGGTSDRIVQVDASSSALSAFVDMENDVETAANACDAGNGTGLSPAGLAILPVRAARLRVADPGPADGETVTVANSATEVFEWDNGGGVTPGNNAVLFTVSECVTRTSFRTIYNLNRLPEVFANDGPCLNGAQGDVALYADAATPDAVVTLAAMGDVSVDANISTSAHLFVGGDAGGLERFVHEFDLAAGPVPGATDTCYLARQDFGAGQRALSVAPTYEGNPGTLVVYAADRNANNRILRHHVQSAAVAVAANVTDAWDVVVAPSGCLLVSETLNERVLAIDVRGGTGTFPVAPQPIVGGFSNMRGLAVDSAEVIASIDPASPASVVLDARLAGAAGNATPLSDTEPNLTVTAFTGGGAGVRARGMLTATSSVTDGNTVTVGSTTYELDTNNTAVDPTRPRVRIATNTADAVAVALALAIRATDVRLLVTDGTANTVVEVGPSLDTTDCF